MTLSTREKLERKFLPVVKKKQKQGFNLNTLNFNKGIAVVLCSIETNAVEYDEDTFYEVDIFFKSQVAIKRAAKQLGISKEKQKNLIEQVKKSKYASIRFRSIDGFSLSVLNGGQNICEYLVFYYHNSYSGIMYDIKLDPLKFPTDEEFQRNTGSVADGDTLQGLYFHYLKGITSGNITFLKRGWFKCSTSLKRKKEKWLNCTKSTSTKNMNLQKDTWVNQVSFFYNI